VPACQFTQMSLRINYESSSESSTTRVMLSAASLLPESAHAEAVAVDGLRVIFQTLQEATARLESKIIATKSEAHRPPIGGRLTMHTQAQFTSIIGEVWIIIDNIRRIHLLLKFIPGVPALDSTSPFMLMINEVKQLRDSLHHIDERINKFYSTSTDPVLGQIMWRERTSIESVQENHVLCSGVQRVSGRDVSVDFGNIDESTFMGRIGIYDLRIRYVKVQKDPITKVWNSGVLTDVNLENAINQVNELIIFIHNKYVQFYNSLSLTEAQSSESFWPIILSLRFAHDSS